MSETLELRIRSQWDDLDAARDSTIEFLEKHGVDPDVIDAVAMVAGELLENSIKYGTYADENEYSIEYECSISPGDITVEVRHPCEGESSKNLKQLDATIQWIRGFQHPFEAYAEKLKQVSTRPYRPGESGLGLVRIAYEGQSVLDFYVDEDGNLSVSAVYQLN